jgi:hypothetical protein
MPALRTMTMRTRPLMIAVLGVGLAVSSAGCGSRVDTTGSATPTSSTPVASTARASTTTSAASNPATTAAPTASSASSASPASTTTAAPANDDVADFCEKTKLLDLSDVTAFEAYDANAAVKLVFTFDKIQKAAPPELADAFKDMRPLVEALNQQVKAGTVHDRESLKAWLLGMNETDPAALEQWVRGQATVVPYIKAHCS